MGDIGAGSAAIINLLWVVYCCRLNNPDFYQCEFVAAIVCNHYGSNDRGVWMVSQCVLFCGYNQIVDFRWAGLLDGDMG